jgi:ubiquinone/menaquinone biosynthesis C-methylase UbiE
MSDSVDSSPVDSSNDKPDYGWDGSPVMLALFLAVSFGLGGYLITVSNPFLKAAGFFFASCGLVMSLLAVVWVSYVKVGKFHRRDRMLSMVAWKGDEKVLDVGTGRGLLMIGAAKKLTRGKAVGIDIWNAGDMLNNSLANTKRNTELEHVGDRVEIRNEDARKLSFPDNSFDVVLSNLCIHNMPSEGRGRACREIARVLKPNGVAVVSDFLSSEYRRVFEAEGLTVTLEPSPLTEDCIPYLHRTLRAVKRSPPVALGSAA